LATTPTWQAPVSGQAPRAAHVNQSLGSHSSVFVYDGTTRASQTTAGSTTTSTNGTWLAQSFATVAGQTTVGFVAMSLTTTTTTGASLSPATVQLRTNNAGAPSTTILASTTVTAEYSNLTSGGATTFRIGVPLAVSGLTASTTYWLVVPAVGNASNNFTWFRSNQTSGASTSTNGTTWTAQAYGFTYAVTDLTATGQLRALYDDGGARWVWLNHASGSQQLNTIFEYNVGQTTAGYLQTLKTVTYSNNVITGMA
jgi:hypothetical protein